MEYSENVFTPENAMVHPFFPYLCLCLLTFSFWRNHFTSWHMDAQSIDDFKAQTGQVV